MTKNIGSIIMQGNYFHFLLHNEIGTRLKEVF